MSFTVAQLKQMHINKRKDLPQQKHTTTPIPLDDVGKDRA